MCEKAELVDNVRKCLGTDGRGAASRSSRIAEAIPGEIRTTEESPIAAIDVTYAVKGNGPPLYMVHGIGSCKEGWLELVSHLEDAFTCVFFDLRGHGASPVPPPPYTLDELVEDLEALRAKLGHDKIHVIGHSLGGMIGPAYARAHPERALSVGLLSTAAGRTEEDREKLRKVGEALEAEGLVELIPTLVARWFTDGFIAAHPEAVERRCDQVKRTPEEVFKSVFHIYATTEMAPWLHEIEQPCLVLTGELDGGCNPRLNRFIAGELENSELVILDGLKHSILIEASDRVAKPLKDFLLKASSASSSSRTSTTASSTTCSPGRASSSTASSSRCPARKPSSSSRRT